MLATRVGAVINIEVKLMFCVYVCLFEGWMPRNNIILLYGNTSPIWGLLTRIHYYQQCMKIVFSTLYSGLFFNIPILDVSEICDLIYFIHLFSVLHYT